MKKTTLWRLSVLVLVILALAACSLWRSDDQETATPSTATAPPTASGTPPGTPLPGATPLAPVHDTPLTLVMWTTEDYAPNNETGGGAQLIEQIQAFKREREVDIDVILKKRSGVGGLLDFMTTASVAAPSVLPDLVTLSASDLYQAAQAGLLQPLDGLLSPELLEDQFDFATELTRVQGATMGVLYQADLQHLVYDIASVGRAPRTWDDLYQSDAPFVFATGAGVNDFLLIQYLSLGGKLVNASGQPALDVEPLTQALEFFQQALDEGIIPPSVLNLSDASIAWAVYRIGEAGMVQVPASLFLADRASLSNAGFGPVPLQITGTTTLGSGWALALVTQDPERQRMTVELIEHLLSPENNGTWTLEAGRLPARRAPLQFWNEDDPYLPFIRDLLAQASPAPHPDLATAIGAPLAEALAQVLSRQATPADAAQAAVGAVQAMQE